MSGDFNTNIVHRFVMIEIAVQLYNRSLAERCPWLKSFILFIDPFNTLAPRWKHSMSYSGCVQLLLGRKV